MKGSQKLIQGWRREVQMQLHLLHHGITAEEMLWQSELWS